MPEHVVHFPGDPGSLGRPCAVLVLALVGLGPLRAVAEAVQELPASPDEHPPRGDREHDRHDSDQDGQRIGGRAVEREHQDRRHPQSSD